MHLPRLRAAKRIYQTKSNARRRERHMHTPRLYLESGNNIFLFLLFILHPCCAVKCAKQSSHFPSSIVPYACMQTNLQAPDADTRQIVQRNLNREWYVCILYIRISKKKKKIRNAERILSRIAPSTDRFNWILLVFNRHSAVSRNSDRIIRGTQAVICAFKIKKKKNFVKKKK